MHKVHRKIMEVVLIKTTFENLNFIRFWFFPMLFYTRTTYRNKLPKRTTTYKIDILKESILLTKKLFKRTTIILIMKLEGFNKMLRQTSTEIKRMVDHHSGNGRPKNREVFNNKNTNRSWSYSSTKYRNKLPKRTTTYKVDILKESTLLTKKLFKRTTIIILIVKLECFNKMLRQTSTEIKRMVDHHSGNGRPKNKEVFNNMNMVALKYNV